MKERHYHYGIEHELALYFKLLFPLRTTEYEYE